METVGKEPEILAYNKGFMSTDKPIVANSGYAKKIGSKENFNNIRIRGAASGIDINSISGAMGSGKVDISISCRDYLKSDMNPLIMIDGIISNMEHLRKIDPKKIESMRIFKDEKATSLFGAKAANGAIVVETKDISKKEKRKLKKLLKQELPEK
ncbi:TonB-dependent receptor plug domain-containing protein [Chryseobacterium arachidis]|uniref:TonB-dependent receptor plug domain-containing protein n=1 Tax=Chryseobacterium arachidis TaxID=1416778 RepID=UPI003615030B